MMVYNIISSMILVDEIFLEVQDGVPHIVVVSHIVRTQDVEGFGVLGKWSAVVVHFFLLVTHSAQTRTETDYAVVDQELGQSHNSYDQVERQEQLFVQPVVEAV
jgi:hypothetical protein